MGIGISNTMSAFPGFVTKNGQDAASFGVSAPTIFTSCFCSFFVSIQPESGEGGRPMKVWRSTSNIL
jgi:hypothetical protein